MFLYDLNKTTGSVESELFKCKKIYWKPTYRMWLSSQLNMTLFDIFPFFLPWVYILSLYKPNYQTTNKEIKNKSPIIASLSLYLQWCGHSFFGKLFTTEGLEADVMPSMDPRRSPDGYPVDKVTRSLEDLGL